jgi:hypothetical protein
VIKASTVGAAPANRRSHGCGLSIKSLMRPDDASFWKSCFAQAIDKDLSPPFVPSFNSNARASREKPYLTKPSRLLG